MPGATYLHIQTRGDAPARLLELPDGTVRVGRGDRCEVRLSGDSLADVQCLLRRSGNAWQVQPVGPRGRVAVDGIPVERPRAWPVGTPLRVGDYLLTLQEVSDEPGEGAFDDSIPVVPDEVEPATPEPEPTPPPQVEARATDEERLARWQASLERRERWLQARKEEARWERRWRTAGERLRARGAAHEPKTRSAAAEPKRPAPPPDPPGVGPASELAEPPREVPRDDRPDAPPRLGCVTRLAPEPLDPSPPRPEPPRSSRPSSLLDPDLLAARLAWETSNAEPVAPVEVSFDPPPEWPAFEITSPGHARIALPSPPPSPRVRPAAEPAVPPGIDRLVEEATWPSVRSILESHRGAAASPRPSRSGSARKTRLTDPREPGQWTLPAALVAPPTIALTLLLGTLGLGLAWTWGQDARVAGPLADHLLSGRPIPPQGIEAEPSPSSSWWASTADHLMLRAAAVGRVEGDPARREQAAFLVGLAANASPAHAGARLALSLEAARRGEIGPMPSRDVVSLGLAVRRRLAEGRAEEALELARDALALAADADPTRAAPPSLDIEPGVKRYRMPNEDLFDPIVRDLAAREGWTFEDWSPALPDSPAAWLAAYRALRAARDPEADRALHEALIHAEAPPAGVVARASRAEALALLERWDESASAYRDAIARCPDPDRQRFWWLNLAEIYTRMNEPTLAREARSAAWGADPPPRSMEDGVNLHAPDR